MILPPFDWSRIAPAALKGIEPLSGGRNSQVVRLCAEDGQSWIGKRYFRHPGDSRDRLGTETLALRAMAEAGIDCVPRLLKCLPAEAVVLMEDCGREVVKNPTQLEALQLADWLLQIQGLDEKSGFSKASEACFCVEELFVNLRSRWERLLQIPNDSHMVVRLHEFLLGRFAPFFQQGREQALLLLEDGGLADQVLPESQRILSPSDFGFHNACRRPDGRLAFFDLEYFGWDDPAKALCDFALHRHDLMQVSSDIRQAVLEPLLAGWPGGADLRRRCRAYYRLFRLKWALILLNEFHPVDSSRRQFAGEDAERGTRLRQRLARVEDFLQHTERDYEEFSRFLA